MLVYSPHCIHSDALKDSIVIPLCRETFQVTQFLRPLLTAKRILPGKHGFGRSCYDLLKVCRQQYKLDSVASLCTAETVNMMREIFMPSLLTKLYSLTAYLPADIVQAGPQGMF